MREGLALLDESMVVVTTQELRPFVVGIVYCGVILACSDAFEVARARQWTQALTEWKEQQPELVAFTGRCLVHRAEILQLGGSWADALEEARLAGRRFVETKNPAAGVAHYRQAELLRLLGRFDAAEEAYREASRFGWEPQPGLAQLRLAQGKAEAALAAIRRANAEATEPLKRAALLPAQVEIALAAARVEEARAACLELRELAKRYESAMLEAIVADAEGAVALAEGDARVGTRAIATRTADLARARRALRGRPHPRADRARRAPRSTTTRQACSSSRPRGSCSSDSEPAPDLARVSAVERAAVRAFGARARGPAARRVREEQPRDRVDARHQRAHRGEARAEHLREAPRLLTCRRDGLRVRARARVAPSRGQK